MKTKNKIMMKQMKYSYLLEMNKMMTKSNKVKNKKINKEMNQEMNKEMYKMNNSKMQDRVNKNHYKNKNHNNKQLFIIKIRRILIIKLIIIKSKNDYIFIIIFTKYCL